MALPDIEGAGDRRRGRGQLSSIDRLPVECDEEIAWAKAQLRERKMPQNEILREFNARLADKGVGSISKSAFNRHSVGLAIEMRKMAAVQPMYDAVLARLAPGDRSESTIALSEMIKYRILEMVTSEEEPDPKLLGNACLSLLRLTSIAAREAEVQRRERKDEREQTERDEKAELIAQENAKAEAADAATRIASEAGLSADRIAAIRKGVLGLAA